jgi:opacity protein-like surface antigen
MNLKKIFLVGLVCAFLAPTNVFAGSAQFKDEDLYASVNVGVAILNDIDFGASLTSQGVTVSAAGSVTYDSAASISGTVGYIINKWVRTEFELGYAEFDHDKAKGDLTFTVGGANVASVGGELNVKGEVKTLSGQATALFTPFGSIAFAGGSLTPLFGGGIGFLNWEDTIDSIDDGTTTLTVNGKAEETDAIYNITAGLEYNQSQNLFVGIRYRHVWADSGQNGFEDAEVDNITGNLTYRF